MPCTGIRAATLVILPNIIANDYSSADQHPLKQASAMNGHHLTSQHASSELSSNPNLDMIVILVINFCSLTYVCDPS